MTVTNASNLNLIVADMDLEIIDGNFEIKNWDAVKAAFVDGWASEYALANEG